MFVKVEELDATIEIKPDAEPDAEDLHSKLAHNLKAFEHLRLVKQRNERMHGTYLDGVDLPARLRGKQHKLQRGHPGVL